MKKLLFVVAIAITFILLPYAQVFAKPGLALPNIPVGVKSIITTKTPLKHQLNIISQAPVITVGQVTGTIVTDVNTPSTTVQQFTVTASGLTDDIVATTPGNFEIATNANGPFSYNATLAQLGGNVNAVLYVRAIASQCGIVSGDVDLTATGVNASAPVSASINQTFTASNSTDYIFFSNCDYNWTNSNPAIGIPASGTGNINPFVAKNLTSAPIVATIMASPAPGCTGPSGSFTITVNPAPAAPAFSLVTIRHGVQVYDHLTATYGSVAADGASGLRGTNLQDSLYFTVTGNFEIGQSGLWRQKSAIDANQINISTAAGMDLGINMRLSPNAPVGNYTGTLTISSAGMASLVYNLSGTVNKAPLTITANNVVKNYGDALTNDAASTAFSANGLKNGETISSASIAYGTGAAVSATPGTYNGSVIASAVTGSNGYLPGNYFITYVSGNITVNPGAIFITPNNADKIYGTSLTGGAGSAAFTITGLPAGQTPGTITITYGTGKAITDDVGTYTGSVVASSLTGGSFNPAYYTISYLPGNINVTPAPLTITANVASKVFGTMLANTPGSTAFTATGLLSGQTIGSVTMSYGTGAAAADNVQHYDNSITPAAATGGTFTAGNYNITYVSARLSVTPALLTVTVNSVNKTYGATLNNTSNSANFTATGLQNGNTVTIISLYYFSGASAAAAVGTYPAAVVGAGLSGANGYLNSNYNTTIVPGDIVVNKANLIIDALPFTKTYGTTAATNGTFAVQVTGLQNGEQTGAGTLTYNGPGVPANAPPGTYTNGVTPSAALANGSFQPDNYNITYHAAAIVVNAAAVTITANNVSKNYGDLLNNNPHSAAFTVTGLQNGDTMPDVSMDYGHGGPATAAAGNYPGTVIPAVNNSGTFTAANYTITYVNGNLTVNKVPLTIKATTVNKVYGSVLNNSSNGAFTVGAGQIKNGEVPAFADANYGAGGPATAPVGTYTNSITLSNLTGTNNFVAGNYDITYLPGDVIVGGIPITITANNVTKTYGATLTGAANSTAFTLSSGTLINGNTLSSVTINYGAGGAPADAMGTYSGSVTPSALVGGNGFVSANYAITYIAGKITVDRATLAITPNDQTKMFGTTLTSGAGKTDFTTTGLQNAETIGSISLNYGTGAAAGAAVGTYTGSVTPSAPVGGTFNTSNYRIIYAPSNIIVTPVPPPVITVTGNISALTTTYGTASITTYNFNISGIFLREGILVTPPTGFEVSLDGINYSPAVTVGAAGTLSPTPVYIRLSTSAPAGTYSGNIVLTSPEASTVYVATDVSTVNSVPLTIATTNVSKPYGDALTTTTGSTNFTITSGTLQNGNIITAVNLNYGIGAAATDGVHTYNGSVTPSTAVGNGGFLAGNYNITYTPANLTVTAVPLTVTANRVTKIYGDALTSASNATAFTTTGLKNGENINTATITYAGGATAASPVGNYAGSATPSAAIGGNGFLAANYQITYAAADVEVSPAPLSITANNAIKTYGTILTDAAASTAFTPAGLKNNEAIGGVNIANGTGAEATAAAGTYSGSVMATGAAGGTFIPANYTITYLPGSITVNTAPLVITGSNISKIYGTALTGGIGFTAFTTTGLLNAETIGSITTTYGTGAAANANAGTYTGAVIPSAATGGTFNPANYAITYAPGNISVNPAPLSITANDIHKVYGITLVTGPGSTAFVANGLQAGEGIGSVSINYSQGGAGNAPAGIYTGAAVASAATGGNFNPLNYSITYTPGSVIVGKAPLTIAANNAGKIYGDALTNTSTSTAFTATGLQNAEAINTINLTYGQGAAATAAPGTYTAAVVPSGGAGTFNAGNYDINYITADINVAQAALTITANNAVKTYGDVLNNTSGATTFTSTPLPNNETIGSITLAYGSGAAATTAAGTYPTNVIPSAASGGTFNPANYVINYVSGSIIVNPALLTITASNASKTYGDALVNHASTTGFTTSPLPNAETIGSITLNYGNGAAANATVGTYAGAATAANPTGGTFNPANYLITYLSGNITVNPATITITAANQTKTYGTVLSNGTSAAYFTTTPLPNAETIGQVNFTYGTGAAATATTGTYTGSIVPSAAAGGSFNPANYVINYLPGAILINPATVTVTANNVTKIYGDVLNNASGVTTFTSTLLPNNESIGSITLAYGNGAAASAAAGTYNQTVVPSAAVGGAFNPVNYAITYLAGNLTVTPAALTITAKNVVKEYGQILPAGPSTAFTASGLVNAETIGNVTLAYSAGAAADAQPGTYVGAAVAAAAAGGTFNPANYRINYLAGTVTVNPPPPGILAAGNLTGLSTTYGTASASGVFTISANNLTAGALVTPPPGFEVSTDNINFSATVTSGSGGTIDSAPIYIRLAATDAVGTYSGNIKVSSSGVSTTLLMPLSVVNKAPLTIAAQPASKVYGTLLNNDSYSKNFTATGLKNAETISSVSISYGTGAAVTAIVAVYPGAVTASAPTGGTFSLSNYDATYIPANITVTPAALLITADNQSRSYGVANPPFTVSYSGFLNNDDVNQLYALPVASTLANTSSLPGQYAITVSGAMAANYDMIYIPGILTVNPGNATLVIPTAFTPNGDGINDTWNILHIDAYPVKTTVDIFDRYGRKVFTSTGYGQAWDGTFTGTPLPNGTYYYIIDPKNNNKPLAGSVTLIR